MFNNVDEVKNASKETILKLVDIGWEVSLYDILSKEHCEIISKAAKLEVLAEEIAFEIRDRYDAIVNDEELGVEEDEDAIDEFMNNIASQLGQKYNGDYEHRPDAFWEPSNCY